ncbi:diacylglycerol/lipid kinase family protein [Microlunatus ginsengisoli]|uniref:Diacylglycerol kinase family protein n=1 Tax=Microlunatus ginsengisoli TaxID=363863 RepID=A0ABP7AHC6_9ACTN
MSQATRHPRYAVVVNPIKVADDFRQDVTDTFFDNGWGRPLWLETTEDDAGRAMTRQALDAGVETVVVAGGDGTVRLVADGLAGTEVKLGIIPSGTGNLLARNLDIPLDREGALHVILAKQTKQIDLIEMTVDGHEPEHFAVMAGAGVDSAIMADADPTLKAKLGPAAYFFSVGKALGRLPLNAKITVDGHRPHHRKAMVVLVGNVGQLVGGIALLPRASAHDGLLHVFVASPHRIRDWLRTASHLVTRRGHKGDTIDSFSGSKVVVEIDEADNYQLDGDVIGEFRRFEAVIKPRALTVYTP